MEVRIFVLGIIISICISANAGDMLWKGDGDYVNIGKSIDILDDVNNEYIPEDVLSGKYKNQFYKSKKNILNFGYTTSIHWLKFTLKNHINDSLLLEVAHASLPITELYYRDKRGEIQKVIAGYQIPMNDKEIIHHYQVFSLPNVDSTEYYLKVLSHSHPLPIKIWKKHQYEIRTYRQRLGYGFYFGLMLFVIIFNIFFFLSLRSKIYLYYAIVVFIYTCYASMVMDGFILYLFPKVDMMFWYVTIPTLGVTVQTAYCLVFLEVRKYTPKLFQVVRVFVFYFLIYFIVRPLLPLMVVLAMNTIHALLSFFIMGFVGINVGKKGNRMGYYYASTYFIYFSLVVVEAIYIQTGYPGYILGLSFVAIATLLEAFVLSYLLSKRSEWERKDSENEKLQAQEKLFETTKENERIVREQNIILENKVAERTGKLNSVNKKLEVAIASKDKFFSIMAHDLKSPFGSLIGLSELLMRDFNSFSEDEKIKYIGIINGGLTNTHNLLENLLLWSQSQQGSLSFNSESVSLYAVTSQTLSYLKQQSESKAITLHNEISGDYILSADKNMLLTILRNLITNAIKFTPSGGDVRIIAKTDADSFENSMVNVSIKDNGVGMSEEQKSYLFDIARNVSTNGTDNESGTGLGLIICKEFVERHNGKIWAESQLGKGTEFCFTMPLYETVTPHE